MLENLSYVCICSDTFVSYIDNKENAFIDCLVSEKPLETSGFWGKIILFPKHPPLFFFSELNYRLENTANLGHK